MQTACAALTGLFSICSLTQGYGRLASSTLRCFALSADSKYLFRCRKKNPGQPVCGAEA